ncbi:MULTISPECIES: flagellar motor switch phosphatase FliY [unclassified Bacillus (in: firmicutes)]|uniref:flagellar motor switch phosphatase FliY n=1 Tax=unclassified Bacillus (in: firmicutes) TaxID=185979 RepID=UPI0008ECE15C|nr:MULTISPECIES: flagellar motor switch phosphatase FliY [unclassified Bacillus (in: firmicutes)]SFA73947.1 flagellar motor switch protein FliN/FliY [Bacillus sp. UNCCL13]SFQ64165.1 flagellar motor switch protein FliN/FliY [Bacillus sp. cl95]
MVSDEMLSQDEIDALLRGTDEDSNKGGDSFNVEDYLSSMEQDALGEIGNISFGSSATALSTLLNQKVEITTPTVTVIERKNMADEFPQPYVAVQVSYTEGFAANNVLVIKQSDAAIIVDLMLGGDGTNPSEYMDEIQLSAVQEAMNQMMGSSATSMSTIFNKRVDISPPSIHILDVKHGEGTSSIPEDDLLVRVSFKLKVGKLIDSNIMQLLPLNFAKSLVDELMNPGQTAVNEVPETKTLPVQEQVANVSHQPVEEVQQQYAQNTNYQPEHQQHYQQTHQQVGQQVPYQQPQQQVAQQVNYQHPPAQPQHFGAGYGGAPANVQPAVFSNFEPYQLQEAESKNLDMLLDIPLQVTVELGRTKRSVKEILELTTGSIIELDKLAGEPVDILVNNRLIAKGEVVVIDENFGVRVTDIISQTDRIKKLR